MRNISASEYKAIQHRKGKEISLGYVYQLMRNGKIPCIQETVTKILKRIPWDDEKMETVNMN